MTSENSSPVDIAERLDRLAPVPLAVLTDLVLRDGACMWPTATDDEPAWMADDMTDRELAARLCGGCPVRDECLELDLRTAGPCTLGVWGGLTDDDRRALYPHWTLRRGRGCSS
jgi:WhiB family redox-sensing transcriptional regulator